MPTTAPKNYDLSSLRLLGIGRRADQSRSVDVVLQERRRREVPDRRHVVADGNRRPHDHRRCRARRRWCRARARCRCRASWRRSSMRPGTTCRTGRAAFWSIKRPWPSMIRTIWGDPDRYRKSLLPRRARRQAVPRRRRRRARQGHRLLHDHGPHRRRAQRLRPSARHDGNRVGAGVESDGRRSRGRRTSGRHDRRSRLRIRRAEACASDRRRGAQRSQTSCATGSARKSARSPSPRTSASATTCRRRAPARSCAGCCARSRRARTITQDISTLENPAILEQLKQAL